MAAPGPVASLTAIRAAIAAWERVVFSAFATARTMRATSGGRESTGNLGLADRTGRGREGLRWLLMAIPALSLW